MPGKLPTDRALLTSIYKTYERRFREFSDDNKTRSTKIWVPVDLDKLSKKFGVDPDLIFGRLYYHMNGKYGYDTENTGRVDIFAPRIGGDAHCINFPFLSAVLADLADDERRFVFATGIAGLSLLVSIGSIILAVLLGID